eukprot:CAMPEP_0170899372 /NCGR_PEP_ID=MMETSP0734-20130129/46611_1 /TAXON_ID=186038 /ORGANISM="Fragilariopsis kerguelensis, Strain L26-C5" /LENGTH=30 /DNA_ID= /DNA_START= /DNA_END= /DNA_ORIENTATION=
MTGFQKAKKENSTIGIDNIVTNEQQQQQQS